MADAAAIREAVTRSPLRCVPVSSGDLPPLVLTPGIKLQPSKIDGESMVRKKVDQYFY
jgi:hypothetical protein